MTFFFSFAELKKLIDDYGKQCKDDVVKRVFGSVLERVLSGKHDEVDNELIEELRSTVLSDNANQGDDESDVEEALKIDDEIEEVVTAKETIVRRMKADPLFNMDDRKWDAMMNKATQGGHLQHLKECEDILDDMQNQDKLLPGTME